MDSIQNYDRALAIRALALVLAGMTENEREVFWREYRSVSAASDDLEGAINQSREVGI